MTSDHQKLAHNCVFQQDSDPKHTSEVVVEWVKQINIYLKIKKQINI